MAPKRSEEEAHLIRAALSNLAVVQVLCAASLSDEVRWIGSSNDLLKADGRDGLMAAATLPLLAAWPAAVAADQSFCRLLLLAAAGGTAQAAPHLGILPLEQQQLAASQLERATEPSSSSDASFDSSAEPTFSSTGAEKNTFTFSQRLESSEVRRHAMA